MYWDCVRVFIGTYCVRTLHPPSADCLTTQNLILQRGDAAYSFIFADLRGIVEQIFILMR
jgi:hypothetical protein